MCAVSSNVRLIWVPTRAPSALSNELTNVSTDTGGIMSWSVSKQPNTHVACQSKRKTGGNTPMRHMPVVVLCLCAVGVTGEHPDFCAVSDVLGIIFNLTSVLSGRDV